MLFNRLTFGAAVLLGALLAPAESAHADALTFHLSVPAPLIPGDKLVAASASGPDDVWAVGYQAASVAVTPIPGDSGPITLDLSSAATQRRTASGWRHQNPPWLMPNLAEMTDVSAATPKDVWVAGKNAGNGFVKHWNGSSWTDRTVRLSDGWSPGQVDNLAAVPGGTAWARGSGGSDNLYHWTGSAWERTPFGGDAGQVVARSADDAWLAGVADISALWHWDGTSWTRQRTPLDDLEPARAYPFAALGPAGDLWVLRRGGLTSGREVVPGYLLRLSDGKWTTFKLPDGSDGFVDSDVQQLIVDGANTPWVRTAWGKIARWDGAGFQPAILPSEPARMYVRGITAVPGTTTIWGVGWSLQGNNTRTDVSSVMVTNG